MKKFFEKHLAEIIVIAVIAFGLSSCGSTAPHHACGITELNKQYSRPCR
tara:strand:- start:340 stop:486 length:147 start_codon:yes stop_codon:yes gene_type:complete